MCAIHDRRTRLFRTGARAGRGLALLARDGSVEPLRSGLAARRAVRRVGVTPRIAPRRSVAFTIRTTTRHRRLSRASMLVCSNDAFAGQSSRALPLRRSGRTRFAVRHGVPAHDAGAERNTGSAAHVLCLGAHGVGPDLHRGVRRHPGIRGGADLTAARHRWGMRAARVAIRRVT